MNPTDPEWIADATPGLTEARAAAAAARAALEEHASQPIYPGGVKALTEVGTRDDSGTWVPKRGVTRDEFDAARVAYERNDIERERLASVLKRAEGKANGLRHGNGLSPEQAAARRRVAVDRARAIERSLAHDPLTLADRTRLEADLVTAFRYAIGVTSEEVENGTAVILARLTASPPYRGVKDFSARVARDAIKISHPAFEEWELPPLAAFFPLEEEA